MDLKRSKIILFGDSLTEQSFKSGGWGAALADTYSRKADVLARGYAGYNTSWAFLLSLHLVRTLEDESQSVIAVTIFFGATDAAIVGRANERYHVPLEEYKQNLGKIVEIFKDNFGNPLIVLITPPPIDEEGRNECARSLFLDKTTQVPERTNAVTGQYAKKCVEVANELGVRSIDLWSKMQQKEGWQKKFLRDGLHLTPEGNAFVHQEVVKVFTEGGLVAEQMPVDFLHHSDIDEKEPVRHFCLIL